jgi:hypothetical protein
VIALARFAASSDPSSPMAAAHLIPVDVDPFNFMIFPDVIFKHREYLSGVSLCSRAPRYGDDFHDNSPFLKLMLNEKQFELYVLSG